MQNNTFFAWMFGFEVLMDGLPGWIHDFDLVGLSYKTHSLSLVTILFKKSPFIWTVTEGTLPCHSVEFCFPASGHGEPNDLMATYWIKLSFFKRFEMACLVTPSVSDNRDWLWREISFKRCAPTLRLRSLYRSPRTTDSS